MKSNNMKDIIMDALMFRHACKEFDGRKLPDDELKFLLEAGRLSPSSYGMQPWKFIVVQNAAVKERLREACNSQKQLTTCSDAVVFCARTDMRTGHEHFEIVMKSRTLDEEKKKKIGAFMAERLADDKELLQWAELQCYIAATNIVIAAAMLRIDSCYIGAFDRAGVARALELHGNMHPSIIVTLGYRKNKGTGKERMKFEDCVEFR